MKARDDRMHPQPTGGSRASPWHWNSVPQQPAPRLRERWQRALGADDPGRLERRLAWEGGAAQISGSMSWPGALDDLRTALQQGVDHPLRPPPTARPLGLCSRVFQDVWAPVAIAETNALRRLSSAPQLLQISDVAWDQLGDRLLERLSYVGEPALWERFNRVRGPGTLLLAQLETKGKGESPSRGFYEQFVREQRADGLGSLLQEFPVLGRLLGEVVIHWREATAEMLRRLNNDLPALAECWGFAPDEPLTGIQQGLSDPHRGGREVALLRFGTDEAATRLLYKPKDMRMDAAFQDLLRSLNPRGLQPPLRTLRILVRPGYGYMEYLPHRPCREAGELERFYRSAGRLTAVLDVLGCIDGHHENLIAHGDQLVLVDAETLFIPSIPAHTQEAAEPETAVMAGEAGGLATTIAESVLRCGLLPIWEFNGRTRLARDVSALGIASPPEATRRATGLISINTDAMRVGVAEVPCVPPTSLPVGIGHVNPFADHLEIYLEGFREQALALASSRERWLQAGGLLERFAGLPRRLVLRPTQVYAVIQQQQLLPAALRNEEAQGLVLEQLARMFVWSPQRPLHWPLFAAEVRDMENLDVPCFAGAVDGRNLDLPHGLPPIEGFLRTTGLEASRRRLTDLDDERIALQCRLIRGAVEARMLRIDEPVANGVGAPSPSPLPPVTRDERDAWTARLARQLAEMAIPAPDGVPEWLGLDLGADGARFIFGPVGNALYGGSAGVALLQALEAQRQQDHGLPDAARILSPLATLGSNKEPDPLRRWWRDQPLGLAGCGGMLLAMLELDRLAAPPPAGFRNHSDLARTLTRALTAPRLQRDTSLDVLAGVAGLIGPLLRLGDRRSLDLAVVAGEHLLRQQGEEGGWPQGQGIAPGTAPPLTGFSHGAAGMAAALARLGGSLGEERFRAGAERALAYERACFDPQRGNWPDYRIQQEHRTFMTGWCHGAPGIALSRLCCRAHGLSSPVLDAELEVALTTTASERAERDNLCCGSMGLVGVLRLAGQCLDEPRWTDAASQLEARAIDRARAHQGRFRMFGTVDGGVLLPGLMTGLSGIALVLSHTPAGNACLGQLLSAGLLSMGGAEPDRGQRDADRQ